MSHDHASRGSGFRIRAVTNGRRRTVLNRGVPMMWNPYENLPRAASFKVTSQDVRDGDKIHEAQVSGIFCAGGQDISPALSWSGFPDGTKSFVVTMFDPDAPTVSGFWHWAVVDIPGNVTKLPTAAGDERGSGLPAGAFQLPNDARMARYIGAAPPSGTGRHRYILAVHAVDTESLGIDQQATPAFLGFNLLGHTLGRAFITAWYEQPAKRSE